ncbi:superoxide dismutase family protein [Microbispora hainanensis]|jgi:Cu-Zn family superoxide dismutase|uniref:Superoxide dismutase [Cu-Zn] n=1 Tax=Microbispora hainanensis TaxID=568844 RepID=A0ABZ1ST10_9ACTN|nr:MULTISPECIES: superoxide dismutase family protein [Microbispora]NJP23920.1 superoxide dismutase family protein [Microbispora sp. CL1-1]TQS15438.1 superoxide dismutase family protein [Microbispora sp. SCL1-1]
MPRTTRIALAAGLALGLTAAAAPAVPVLAAGMTAASAPQAGPGDSAGASANEPVVESAGGSATAVIKNVTGRTLGTVRVERYDAKKSRVSVSVRGLTPGFHGFHVHSTGVCDAHSVDRATGSAFSSAGSHLGPGQHGGGAGDMPPLLAAADGTASASFVTDRFTLEQLGDANGSAFVVHAAPDNFAHIPDRYFHRPDAGGAVGPDATTRKTGDAGARIGCGVVKVHA